MMEDTVDMVREMVARVLADTVSPQKTMASEDYGLDVDTWAMFKEIGLRGGEDALEMGSHIAILEQIGSAAVLVPYAESEVLGRWLARAAGLDVDGADTLSVVHAPRGAADIGVAAVFELRGRKVAWGRHAKQVLILGEFPGGDYVALAPAADFGFEPGANLAGEPLDTIGADRIAVPLSRFREVGARYGQRALQARGAVCRVASMAGALRAANALALRYAQDRRQFGRSLSEFQVIQSYLAAMAAEVCAASVALDMGREALESNDEAGDVAVAKIRAGLAVRVVGSLAHQIHGAMGMTREYPLQLLTRRLWAWREEYGNEAWWSARLGASFIAGGESAFWPSMSRNVLIFPSS